jgi:hypothetical protein
VGVGMGIRMISRMMAVGGVRGGLGGEVVVIRGRELYCGKRRACSAWERCLQETDHVGKSGEVKTVGRCCIPRCRNEATTAPAALHGLLLSLGLEPSSLEVNFFKSMENIEG